MEYCQYNYDFSYKHQERTNKGFQTNGSRKIIDVGEKFIYLEDQLFGILNENITIFI